MLQTCFEQLKKLENSWKHIYSSSLKFGRLILKEKNWFYGENIMQLFHLIIFQSFMIITNELLQILPGC